MSDFEYLSVLIAIIVGIGITHLLMSLGRILGETKRLNAGVVPLIWTGNVLVMLVVFWWWGINLRQLEEWVFLHFLLLLFDTSLWCLLATILYPRAIPPDFDLTAHFARKRKAFFGILVLLAFPARVRGSFDLNDPGDGTSSGFRLAILTHDPGMFHRWNCSHSIRQ